MAGDAALDDFTPGTARHRAARPGGPADPGGAGLPGRPAAAFEPERQARLAARKQRQARFDAGELPDFRADTRAIREGDWTVAPLPAALLDRRVEITGPVDPKMVINALNSGAKLLHGRLRGFHLARPGTT